MKKVALAIGLLASIGMSKKDFSFLDCIYFTVNEDVSNSSCPGCLQDTKGVQNGGNDVMELDNNIKDSALEIDEEIKNAAIEEDEKVLIKVDNKIKNVATKEDEKLKKVTVMVNGTLEYSGIEVDDKIKNAATEVDENLDNKDSISSTVPCLSCVQPTNMSSKVEEIGAAAVEEIGAAAVEQLSRSSLLSSCAMVKLDKLVGVTSKIVTGTNYNLTLKLETFDCENIGEKRVTICKNVVMFEALPFTCRLLGICLELIHQDQITCDVVD